MNKIGLYGPNNIQKPKTIEKTNSKSNDSGAQNSGAVKKDSVSISQEARIKTQASDVQYLKELAGKPEGTDQAKLNSIKEQIQNGTYSRDFGEIADAILDGLA